MSRFEGQDFYKVLGVDKKATLKEIQRAYRLLAVKIHPDKNPNDEQAKVDFQMVSRIMETLGDEKKRERYDKYGDTDNDESEQFSDAYERYRAQFSRITKMDIHNYEKQYRNSQMELDDLCYLYNKYEGNMCKIMQTLVLSRAEDIDRYVDYLRKKIKDGSLEKFKQFNSSIKKAKREEEGYKKEEEEAKKEAEKMGLEKKEEEKRSSDGADEKLIALISSRRQLRQSQFEQFIAEMESKYIGDEEDNKPVGKRRYTKKKSVRGKRKREEENDKPRDEKSIDKQQSSPFVDNENDIKPSNKKLKQLQYNHSKSNLRMEGGV